MSTATQRPSNAPYTPIYYPDLPQPWRGLMARSAARAWCKQKEAAYAERTDCCAKWRFRAIHVREVIRPVTPRGRRRGR